MASTQLQTVTASLPYSHGRALFRASTRLWGNFYDGSNYVHQYSDDDGASWSGEVTIRAANTRGGGFYDSTGTRANFATAGENSLSVGLSFHSISSNVTSGLAGSVTSTTLDAGGGNAGVNWPYAFMSPTGTRPRYWIIGQKTTAASTYETRAWHVDVTTPSNADTAGNWSTTNFTNLGGNSDANSTKLGIGWYWTISGNPRVTMVMAEGSMGSSGYDAVTFDPTVATPTPGSVTTSLFVHSSDVGNLDPFPDGAVIGAAAVADYAVFGRYDNTAGTASFWKSTDGVTWTAVTSGTGLTMGRFQIATDGTDFYVIYASSYGAHATTSQTLSYRKITKSTSTMGGASTFSDQNGNPVAVPDSTGTSKLYGLYRGSTASPYTVRSDFVSIAGGADTNPPGPATTTVTAVTSTTVAISSVMPSDSDVAEWEGRYLVGTSFPATNRSDGTIFQAPTATTTGATVTDTITGLTANLVISGRVFVKDTTGNWNDGTSSGFQATPSSAPVFVRRLKADGQTVVGSSTLDTGAGAILEYDMDSGNMLAGGAPLFLEFISGTDNATPPTLDTEQILSLDAPDRFQYQDANGVWQSWPAEGLTSADWGRLVRVKTNASYTGAVYGSLRVRQINP